MSPRINQVALAIMALYGVSAYAEESSKIFSYAAFGTIAATHNTDRNADYVSNIFQPNGAGRSRSIDLGSHSRLGGQVTGVFSDRLTGVLQVISQKKHDSTNKPQVEWANLKYDLTPSLSARVGRIAQPAFMISDSRLVGYAQPWLRPSIEVYNLNSITRNDGLDISYRMQLSGGTNNTIQAFVGKTKGTTTLGDIRGNPSFGLNNLWESGSLSLRASFISTKMELDYSLFNGFFTRMTNTANTYLADASVNAATVQAVGANILSAVQAYHTNEIQLKTYAIGANYDPGKWFLMAELAMMNGDRLYSDNKAGYVTAGYRIKGVTPYVMYSKTHSDLASPSRIPVPTSGLTTSQTATVNAYNSGLSLFANSFNWRQRTASLGMRVEVSKNAALKAQYDKVHLGEASGGRFANGTTAFQRGNRQLEMWAMCLDFVF